MSGSDWAAIGESFIFGQAAVRFQVAVAGACAAGWVESCPSPNRLPMMHPGQSAKVGTGQFDEKVCASKA